MDRKRDGKRSGSALMLQSWSALTFIHYPIEPEIVQATLPRDLTVETFPDKTGRPMAWIGLVPFLLEDLALLRFLRIPSAHRFLETNVRTYVNRDGKDSGVWFYSLEAESWLACLGAKLAFGLPYHHAAMRLERKGQRLLYSGERHASPSPLYRVTVEPYGEGFRAQPGTLDYFLVERYRLYSTMLGRVTTAAVRHRPYPLQRAKLILLEDELSLNAGFEVGDAESVLFSSGVTVDVVPFTEQILRP